MIDLAALRLSFEVAAIATGAAVVVGVALAGALAHARFAGRDVVDALVTAPLVLPPTVLGYYALSVLGRDSVVGRAFEAVTGSPIVFTFAGLVVAGFLGALPLVVKSSRAALEAVDPQLTGAARTLGASPLRVFFTVVLPLAKGGVTAGAALGFARALGDFGVTLMLAGNIAGRTRTASLSIYDAVMAGRDADANGLAAVLAALAVLALTLANRLTRRRDHER
jgi:molybdate transport system permease protein